MSNERLMRVKRYCHRVRVPGEWNGSMILGRKRNVMPTDGVVLIHACLKMHGRRAPIIVLSIFMGAM